MTICQYKQSTEQYAFFKNKVKLKLTVLSNLFRTLRTHCIIFSTGKFNANYSIHNKHSWRYQIHFYIKIVHEISQ
jgi:hypothetical protein